MLFRSQITGRTISASTETDEFHVGDGSKWLLLREFPVTAVSALKQYEGDAQETLTAISYAVLSFIEQELGVRWFAPGDLWEYLPEVPEGELTVAVADRVVTPGTPLRIWSGHDDWDWQTSTG